MRRQLVVAPNGDVLPCLAAGQLPGLDVVNVRDADLAWWTRSAPPGADRRPYRRRIRRP